MDELEKKETYFGTFILLLRRLRGLTQTELAVRSHLSQPTIGNIEKGTSSPARLPLNTLRGLAEGLNTDIETLIRVATRDSQHVTRAGRMGPSPETLAQLSTREGDRLAALGKWKESLRHYEPAFRLRGDEDDRERIDLLIHGLGQTYINLCALDHADRAIEHAEEIYLLSVRNVEPLRDPEIEARLLEKKAWIANRRGDFTTALRYFADARPPAQEVGDQGCVETSYHFSGRVPIESQMPLLFPGLGVAHPGTVDVRAALRNLEISRNIRARKHEDLGVAFNMIWQARGLLHAGQLGESKQLLQHSFRIFAEGNLPSGEAEALIELARISALTARGDESTLTDTKDQLTYVMGLLTGTQFPFIVARVYILQAYCDFLIGKYTSERRIRRRGADACELAKRIFPYPYHPLSTIARLLERHFVEAMEPGERREYARALVHRMRERRDSFNWLDKFLQIDPI